MNSGRNEMSAGQPNAYEQYLDWKKWPSTYREPTHEEWLVTLKNAVAQERERLKKVMDVIDQVISDAETYDEESGLQPISKKTVRAAIRVKGETK